MALDALLHLGSVAVLAIVVVVATKLLTRGFVDAKLFTGLLIATLLVIVRVTLLNYVGQILPGVAGQYLMVIVIIGLYLSAFILVYKFVSIPALGTALSSAVIVSAQVYLAGYIPKLSLQLMPEGQRFAEYAGLANSRTKQLMADAKAYRHSSGGIQQILADALEAIQFFTSDKEQAQLSKDFASGIALYKERKAYMDNMTPEELASYRRAMSAFLQEQGLAENRYSLSNLKNAKPEDLENLASFMKDMNKVYGFTDDLPEGNDSSAEDLPTSAESLAQIAQQLSQVEMSGSDMAKLGSLFSDLGIDADSVMAGMAQAREDLAGIRKLTETMAGELKQLVTERNSQTAKRDGIFVNNTLNDQDDVIISGGYRIKKLPNVPSYSKSLFSGELGEEVLPEDHASGEVSYFMPEAMPLSPNESIKSDALTMGESPLASADRDPVSKNYYKAEELSPVTTEQSIVLIPQSESEQALWLAVSERIEIDAWFASASETGLSTIFIEGVALQDGDVWEHAYEGETYRFAFKGIQENLITLIALERVVSSEAVNTN